MEEALIHIGLPVKCRCCDNRGFVKPCSDYGGWYKSKFYRLKRLKWFCPEHYEIGRDVDNKFYENYKTPDPYNAKDVPSIEEELYALLD